MGHESRYTSVTVVERMYPQDAMVGSRNCNDGLRLGQLFIVVGGPESIEKNRQIGCQRRHVTPDLHFAVTKFARDNPYPCTCVSVLDPQQFIRQPATELLVNPLYVRRRIGRLLRVIPVIDQTLDLDMRASFKLQDASFRIRGIVVRQSGIDVARVSIVALDEVRVVAIHRAHEVANALANRPLNLARQVAGSGDQVDS